MNSSDIINFIVKSFDYINTFDYTGISLLVMYMILGVILYKVHNSEASKFFIDHLFLDDEGKASTSKLAQIIALVTSSWAFINLTLNDKLTEWFFGLYMTVWVINRGFTKWLDLKKEVDTVDLVNSVKK
jgi:hypothetical protein